MIMGENEVGGAANGRREVTGQNCASASALSLGCDVLLLRRVGCIDCIDTHAIEDWNEVARKVGAGDSPLHTESPLRVATRFTDLESQFCVRSEALSIERQRQSLQKSSVPIRSDSSDSAGRSQRLGFSSTI